MNFVFFGTDNFSVAVLETLKQVGLSPVLIVTNPDRPKGRKLALTPPPAKVWANQNQIPILQPEKLNSDFTFLISKIECQFFLVASFGKIIPKEIIELPKYKSLNIHPSLLPKLRGPSPIQETILQNETPGVTIMRMNEKMDQGPIIAQKKLELTNWPMPASWLNKISAVEGAKLFAEVIGDYLSGKIKERPQNDEDATYTKMIQKNDGLIDLKDDPGLNFRKFLAYEGWPGVYFLQNDKRIKITEAEFRDGKFVIKRVIPEGKKEMAYRELT